MEGRGALRYVRHCHTPRGARRAVGLDSTEQTARKRAAYRRFSPLPFPSLLLVSRFYSERKVFLPEMYSSGALCSRRPGCPGQQGW